ncbi:hypothetical protein HDU90_003217 [Geranomyces variabilis]|nr:hypothetical protein HDU90_003217 [Geranomyces variabilis]
MTSPPTISQRRDLPAHDIPAHDLVAYDITENDISSNGVLAFPGLTDCLRGNDVTRDDDGTQYRLLIGGDRATFVSELLARSIRYFVCANATLQTSELDLNPEADGAGQQPRDGDGSVQPEDKSGEEEIEEVFPKVVDELTAGDAVTEDDATAVDDAELEVNVATCDGDDDDASLNASVTVETLALEEEVDDAAGLNRTVTTAITSIHCGT